MSDIYLRSERYFIHEQAYRTGFVARSIEEDGKQWSSGILNYVADVSGHQKKANEEDEAGEDSDTDASQHNSRTFD